MHKFLLSLAVCALLGQAPALAQGVDTLTVAAAANLASVAEPLKAAFTARYPGVSVQFVLGSSGALTSQIQNGAPFDLFLSADVEFPQKVFDAGLAAAAPQVYAQGRLILLSVQPRDLSAGLGVLASQDVTQFALANPDLAPYGRAAQEALVKAGLWDSVKAKAVVAQSITQALQFTLGATGVGLVNRSALSTKELAPYADKPGVHWWQVDPSWHSPLNQAFVVLKSAAGKASARNFAAFLGSAEARALLAKAGYALP